MARRWVMSKEPVKEVVFEDQVGYIKGRNITTTIRLIMILLPCCNVFPKEFIEGGCEAINSQGRIISHFTESKAGLFQGHKTLRRCLLLWWQYREVDNITEPII